MRFRRFVPLAFLALIPTAALAMGVGGGAVLGPSDAGVPSPLDLQLSDLRGGSSAIASALNVSVSTFEQGKRDDNDRTPREITGVADLFFLLGLHGHPDSGPTATVPEPGTALLVLLGLSGLALRRR